MADNDKASPEDAGTSQLTSPSQVSGEANWILHGINQLHEKRDRLDDRFMDRFDEIDARLRNVENRIWMAIGGGIVFIAVIVVIQFLIGNFDFSITAHQT